MATATKARKPLSKARWARLAEEKIYAEQPGVIEKECGKEASRKANYGWGVSAGDDYVDVATKVYGKRARILSSRLEYPSLEPDHDWRDY